MKKTIPLIMILLMFLISSKTWADIYYGGGIGSGDVDVPGYDDAVVFRLQMGARDAVTGWEFGLSFGSYDVTGSFGVESNDVSEMDVSFMGYLPIAPTIDVFGRVGAMYWNIDKVLYQDLIIGSDDGVDLFYGAGFDFAMSDRLDLRLEIQVLPDVAGAEITQTIVGINYRMY